MSLQQRDLFIKQIFSIVAPHVDTLSRAFSFGFDRLWRRKAVSLSGVKEGDKVLDVCTGTGELAILLSRKTGDSGWVVGVDFCESMLERAKNKTGSNHGNLSFLVSDAKSLPFPDGAFDAVTVSFGMRNIPDTGIALREIKRVLRPGGGFLCLELTRPSSRWFSALYRWYIFTVIPYIGKKVVKTAAPYSYLPASINAFYQPDEFTHIIENCGFSGVSAVQLTMGVATVFRAVKNNKS